MLNPSYGFRNMDAAPLTPAELAATLDAIGGFETRPFIAVAVSGGPDSLALAILADRWARQRGGAAWALTVDHGLRPESAEETRRVADWLAARGIPHEILPWRGDKPATGIQEAARTARYLLLSEWCRNSGCLHLLTAHHREDQAETHLIRRRAGSGVDGLAGMAAVRELPHCRLVRPLLGVPRARLAALIAAEGQPFLSDPSNRDPRFERARLRADVGALALEDVTAALRMRGEERISRERDLDRLLARAVSLHPAGFAALEPQSIAAAPVELAERLLGRVAATIGGARYPLRRDRVARLRTGLTTCPGRARTLGGCRFVPWRGHVLVLRELASAAAPLRLEPGEAVLWDRRFTIALPQTAGGSMTVGYFGQFSQRSLAALVQSDGAQGRGDGAPLPRWVDPILPAIWDAEGLLAVPHRGYRRRGIAVLPEILFCPANPLGHAGFTVV